MVLTYLSTQFFHSMDEQKNDSGFLVFPRKSLILKRRRGLASGGPPLGKRQPAWNKIYVQFLKRAFLFSAVKLILCSRSTPGTWCHSFSSLANSLLCSLLRHHVNHKQENWCEQTYFKIGLKIPPLPGRHSHLRALFASPSPWLYSTALTTD